MSQYWVSSESVLSQVWVSRRRTCHIRPPTIPLRATSAAGRRVAGRGTPIWRQICGPSSWHRLTSLTWLCLTWHGLTWHCLTWSVWPGLSDLTCLTLCELTLSDLSSMIMRDLAWLTWHGLIWPVWPDTVWPADAQPERSRPGELGVTDHQRHVMNVWCGVISSRVRHIGAGT